MADTTDTRTIPLSQGLHATVDAADYDWLSQWKWSATRCGKSFYVLRNFPIGGGRYKRIYMHRLIMSGGAMVDHIDHNPLNNTRANLRYVTPTESLRNRRSHSDSTSRYLGVSWDSTRGKWAAAIKFDGRKIYLGRFDCEADAARAYDKSARLHFGEFANPNFP